MDTDYFTAGPTMPGGGDPFLAASRNPHPHACICYFGWVYIGHVVESPDDLEGEVEVFERVPCRRCREKQ